MTTLELAYESYGEPGGTPLVLIHGFMASSRNWRSVAKQLARRYHVYVLDMRNHGASPHATLLDYPSMAADLAAFIDSLGLDRVHLLGHSMGGEVAMWLALHQPHWIDRLIVADIAPVGYQHSFDTLIDALRSVPVDSIVNRKQAEEALADGIPDLAYRQFLLQNLLLKDGRYQWRIDLDIIRDNAHHIVGFPDAAGRAYSRPVLFIGGGKSRYLDRAAIGRLFPRASVSEIPDTGHWLYVEAPQAFCGLVDDWLAGPAD